jgi:hypothetical protein
MNIKCPNCGNMTFNTAAYMCSECLLVGDAVTVPEITPHVLSGLLTNVRIMVARLGPLSFMQLAGPFSPRPGYGAEDAIPFTETTAKIVFDHLVINDVKCSWFKISADNEVCHSLVFAADDRGLRRGKTVALKAAHRFRGRFEMMG